VELDYHEAEFRVLAHRSITSWLAFVSAAASLPGGKNLLAGMQCLPFAYVANVSDDSAMCPDNRRLGPVASPRSGDLPMTG
jgi:hypothetical protein